VNNSSSDFFVCLFSPAVLAISTPDDEFNYYTELLECGLFETIKIGLVCGPCEQKGIACTHRKHKLPNWKSGENHDKVLKIMATQQSLAMRELGGIVITDKLFIFRRNMKEFHSAPRYQFQHRCQVLHVSIDPSGGGSGSHYAIYTIAIENGIRIVSMLHMHLYPRQCKPPHRSDEAYYGSV